MNTVEGSWANKEGTEEAKGEYKTELRQDKTNLNSKKDN